MKPWVILAVLFCVTGIAVAQTTAPSPAFDGTSLMGYLGSVPGIVILTMGLVEIIKRLLLKYKVTGFEKIPVPGMAIGIAGLLTLISNLWGPLQGDWYELVFKAVISAGTAGGWYTWIREPLDSPKRTNAKLPILLLAIMLLPGCTWSTATMTPEQRIEVQKADYLAATEIYEGSGNTAAMIIRLKILSEPDARILAEAVHTVRLCLDEWAAAIELQLPADKIIERWKLLISDLVAKRIAAERVANQVSIGDSDASDRGISRDPAWRAYHYCGDGVSPTYCRAKSDRRPSQVREKDYARADSSSERRSRVSRRQRPERARGSIREAFGFSTTNCDPDVIEFD